MFHFSNRTTVKPSDFAPHRNFGPILARSDDSSDDFFLQNMNRTKFANETFFYKFHSLHFVYDAFRASVLKKWSKIAWGPKLKDLTVLKAYITYLITTPLFTCFESHLKVKYTDEQRNGGSKLSRNRRPRLLDPIRARSPRYWIVRRESSSRACGVVGLTMIDRKPRAPVFFSMACLAIAL